MFRCSVNSSNNGLSKLVSPDLLGTLPSVLLLNLKGKMPPIYSNISARSDSSIKSKVPTVIYGSLAVVASIVAIWQASRVLKFVRQAAQAHERSNHDQTISTQGRNNIRSLSL